MSDLKLRIRKAVEFVTAEVSRFEMWFEPHGWAVFYVDHSWGALTITSDYGVWSHTWGSNPKTLGAPSFLAFIMGKNGKPPSYHYLADKLSYGTEPRRVPDVDGTIKGMLREVLMLRRQDSIGKSVARHLWEEVDEEFRGALNDSFDEAYRFSASDEFDEVFEARCEWLLSKCHPKEEFLRDQLLPAFIGSLRGEVVPQRAAWEG